jgi:hypothetical protein
LLFLACVFICLSFRVVLYVCLYVCFSTTHTIGLLLRYRFA